MQSKLEQLKQDIASLEHFVFKQSKQLYRSVSELSDAHRKDQQTILLLQEDNEQLKQQLTQCVHVDVDSEVMLQQPIQEHFLPPSRDVQVPQRPSENQVREQPLMLDHVPDPIQPTPTIKTQSYFQLCMGFLLAIFQFFSRLSVLGSVYEQGIGIFKHYQQQGKTAVFLLTVSGILLLVTGFAYMLQYSFVQLSLEWKLFCAFILSTLVVGMGAKLYELRQDMQDYAAALIGLGLVLAYLCAYFIGTAFVSDHSLLSFVLLAGLTGVAYVLALVFNTRVVALVSLVGGACLPLLGEGQAWLMLAYPGYLLLLNISSLHLAHSIRWTTLSYIAFVLSAAMLEYQFSQGLQAVQLFEFFWLVLVFHALFYVYLYYSYRLLATGAQSKGAILMIANMLLFVVLLSQLLEPSMLGGVLLANALLLSVLFAQQYLRQDMPRATMLLLQAGVFTAFAIFTWLDAALASLLWGVEAICLLYIGLRFQIIVVRYEAYSVLFLAVAQAVWQCQMLIGVSSWYVEGVGLHWLLLLSIGVLLQVAVLLLSRDQKQLQAYDVSMQYLLREVISGWLLVGVLISIYLLNSDLYLLAILPLIFFLLERSARLNLRFTEVSAWLLFSMPLLQIIVSADVAGSFMFSAMDWLGQLAWLESFALLWLTSAFYLRRYPRSRWMRWVIPMQAMFYVVIPICFLAEVFESFYAWFPLVLWLSSLMCFALFCWRKYQALYIEQMLLTLLAVAFSLNAAIWHTGLITIAISLALLAGLAYFSILIFYYKAWSLRDKKHAFYPLLVCSLYYAAACIFLLSLGLFQEVLLALLTLQFFIMGVVWFFPYFQPIRSQLGYWYLLALAMPSFMLGCIVLQLEFASIVLLLWPAVLLSLLSLHVKRRHFGPLWTFKGSYEHKLLFAHICLFAVYSTTLLLADITYFQASWSVVMLLHATLMLFFSLWERYVALLRASIVLFVFVGLKITLYDLYDLTMMAKMVAFMLMGSLLLLAAYAFQRLKNYLKQGSYS